MTVSDPQWASHIARLLRRTRATVLPAYFPGANGPLFQLAGLLHPSLRTALLPHALLDRRDTRIEVRIGRPISWSRMAHIGDDDEPITHLRRRTYLLSSRRAVLIDLTLELTLSDPQFCRCEIRAPGAPQSDGIVLAAFRLPKGLRHDVVLPRAEIRIACGACRLKCTTGPFVEQSHRP